MPASTKSKKNRDKPVRLKDVAKDVGLSTAAVSTVLNRSARADSIPQATKERIFEAAERLGYRPNLLARSLRSRRSMTIGVLVPEITEAYAGGVLGGIEHGLMQDDYFYFVASHQSQAERLERCQQMLADRAIDGFIMVNTPLESASTLPMVAIAGHQEIDGVLNVVLDHETASELAMDHLVELGHRRIAGFRGQPSSADTEDRWNCLQRAARERGIEIPEECTVQLGEEIGGRLYDLSEMLEEGYGAAMSLIDRGAEFTALVGFNDHSALGAMRAFRDRGMSVPEQISVIGFDDIPGAEYHIPSLTTIRQPLHEMGSMAAQLLTLRLRGEEVDNEPVTVAPELIVRESTATARS